jgi:bifunctional non-homologous end joining protein LigD
MPRTIRSQKQNARRRHRSVPAQKLAEARRKQDLAAESTGAKLRSLEIPRGVDNADIEVEGGSVHLTNLQKIFWPELGLTKRDLLQYYLDVSPLLLPHLKDRAMVMKRYPNGIHAPFFFMKRAPSPRPGSIPICSIEHTSGNIIAFPVIQHLASLLWVVNLGCIDLNPWYARCDDVYRPDYLHFDLDPTPDTPFERVLQAALLVRDALAEFKLKSYAKTTGSRGMHVYIPIERGPGQKDVWRFAKAFSRQLAQRHPRIMTAEYRVAKRPAGRVLADYNQNAWNRTLASVYSVRPTIAATVSTPVTWEDVERGIRIEDFTMKNVPARVRKLGDLWRPLLAERGRVRLDQFL